MAAHEHLSGVQFAYQHYPPSETGTSFDQHRVSAHIGGQEVGHMSWNPHGVSWVGVNQEHERKGIGTALWHEGHRIAAENPKVVKPQHSGDRTDAGDAWARSVGGRIPRRKP